MVRDFLRLIFVTLVAWGVVTTASRADYENLKIENPVAIAARAEESCLYVATGKGELIRWWDNGEQVVIASDLTEKPASLNEVSHLFCRKGFVSAVGKRNGLAAFAAYALDENPKSVEAKWVPGISQPLEFANGKQVRSLAATPVSVYTAVSDSEETVLWRVDLRVATMADPVRLHVGKEDVTAVAVNFQGHLLAAVKPTDNLGGKTSLRFHHARSGSVLLQIPTDLDEINSLIVGPDELLYAAGRRGEVTGVFRIDVAYRNRRQATDVRLIEQRDNISQIASSAGHLIVLDGKAVGRIALFTDSATQ